MLNISEMAGGTLCGKTVEGGDGSVSAEAQTSGQRAKLVQ